MLRHEIARQTRVAWDGSPPARRPVLGCVCRRPRRRPIRSGRSRWSCRSRRAGRPTSSRASSPARCRRSLGQNVIVDNRGGAAGNIGMGQAARATPDGYTLLLTSTAIAVNPGAVQEPALRSDQGLRADLRTGERAERAGRAARFRHQLDRRPGRAGQGRAEQVQLCLARAPAPSRISPANCSSCAPASSMVHVPFRGGGPGRAGGARGHRAGRLGGAGAGRAADQGRPAARAGGHQREALVLAARRADHDRVRLSRVSSPTPSTRCSRRPARRRRSSRCLVKESRAAMQQPGGARAGAQGRLRDRRRHAGAARGARAGRDSGVRGAGRQGRHQAAVTRRE